MFRRCLMVFCAVSLALPSVGAHATVTYTFTALTPAGSDTQAYPLAMNVVNGAPQAAGVTGGGTTNVNQGYPCLWGSAGGTGADVLSYISGGGDKGKVFAIDSAGDVVGNTRTAVPGPPTNDSSQAAFFLASGSTSGTVLPMLTPGDTYAIAYGVQNSSTVVGIEGASPPATNGVIWTKTGSTWSAAALPLLSATTPIQYCGAYAMSATGIVVGSGMSTSGMQTAVEWTNSSSGWAVSDLLTHGYPNGQNSSGWAVAKAVNDSGVAVGESTYVSGGAMPNIIVNAVVFKGGNPVSLGTFGDGSNNDCANGINDSGVIVGQSSTSGGVPVPFIYGLGGNDTMQNLNTVFANVIPSGWTLTNAVSIDNRGDIAGIGTDSSLPGDAGVGFVIRARLLGDANGDGTVDVNDLTIVLSHYGQTGMTWSQGDFVGDGTVDVNDLTIVLANFGQSLGSSAGAIAAVPEPSVFWLLVAALASLLAWCRRNRR